MKGTKDITKSERVSKEASDDYTRFTVHQAQIADSGTYFVLARNANGTDRIFVTVDVSQMFLYILFVLLYGFVQRKKSSLKILRGW